MREIILSTETGSDLPQEMAEKYQIHTVPMHVIMDDIDRLDDCNFSVQEIYDYYERTKKVPTTSAVNVWEYIDFFRAIRDEHPNCIIFHLAYSSGASSTYQNARLATEEFADIYVIDTTMVTAGCIPLLLAAHELIRNNPSRTDYDALADEIRAVTPRLACSFLPGNLDFLKAGGRVSNAAYLGATILQIKPLINLDREGRLVAGKKYRGSMERIAGLFVREFVEQHQLERKDLYLIHTPETARAVLEQMRIAALDLGFRNLFDIPTSGVITSHSGPGSIGLAGITEA